MVHDNSMEDAVDKNGKANTNEDYVSSSNNDQGKYSNESNSTGSKVL